MSIDTTPRVNCRLANINRFSFQAVSGDSPDLAGHDVHLVAERLVHSPHCKRVTWIQEAK